MIDKGFDDKLILSQKLGCSMKDTPLPLLTSSSQPPSIEVILPCQSIEQEDSDWTL